jgi:hypothetical protein
MKCNLSIKQLCILIGLTLCVFSCIVSSDQRSSQIFYSEWGERTIGFVNSIPHVDSKGGYFDLIMSFKWGGTAGGLHFDSDTLAFSWIRDPSNILYVHKTLLAIGYLNFISKEEFEQPMDFRENYGGMRDHHWEGLSIANVIDSLILSYENPSLSSQYYKSFWDRRKAESTKDVLASVLIQIKDIYGNKIDTVNVSSDSVGSQLETLLRLDLELQEYAGKPTGEFLQKYFNYLISIGLEHSAYNLATEKFPDLISRDSVISILRLDTISENEYWRTRNYGTWIFTYRDNGP